MERTVYVRATEPDAVRHLEAYSGLFSPKRAAEHELHVATSGDWVAIRLPEAVHPWQLHNLAFWMLDCDAKAESDVVAESGPGPTHPAYWLVCDDEVPDALCGWDVGGWGWTVHVPDNAIVRGEDVPVSQARTRPSGFGSRRSVTVLLEDPGADMNPSNDSTAQSRPQSRDRSDGFGV